MAMNGRESSMGVSPRNRSPSGSEANLSRGRSNRSYRVQQEYDHIKDNVRDTLSRELERLSAAEAGARLEIQQELENENDQLRAQNLRLQERLEQMNNHIHQLEGEKADLQAKLDLNVYTLTRQRDEARAEADTNGTKLSEKLDKARAAQKAAEDALAAADKKAALADAARATAEQRANNVTGMVNKLSADLDHAQRELDALKQSHAELENRANAAQAELSGRLTESEYKRDQRATEVAELKNTLSRVRKERDEARERLNDDQDRRARTVVELEERINAMDFENALLKRKLAEEMDARGLTDREKGDVHRQNQALAVEAQRLRAELEHAHVKVDEHKQEKEAAREEVVNKVQEVEALRAAHGELKKREETVAQVRQRLEDEHAANVRDLRDRVKTAENDAHDLARQLQDAKRNGERTAADLQEKLSTTQRDKAGVEKQLEIANNHAKDVQSELDALEAELEYKNTQLLTAQNQLADLERELVVLTEERNGLLGQVRTEADRARDATDRLRENQLNTQQMLEGADEKIRDLTLQLQQLQKQHDRMLEKQKSTGELQAQLDAAMTQLAALKNGLEDERLARKKVEASNAALAENNAFKTSQTDEALREAHAAKAERDKAIADLRAIEGEIFGVKNGAQKALDAQAGRLAAMEAELNSLKGSDGEWKDKYLEMKGAMEGLERDARTQIKALKIQLAHENEERAQLEKRLQDEVELRAGLQSKNSPSRTDGAALRRLRDELQAEYAQEKRDLTDMVNTLTQEKAAADEDRSYLAQQLAAETKARQALEKLKAKFEQREQAFASELVAAVAHKQEALEALARDADEYKKRTGAELRDLRIQLELALAEKKHLEQMLLQEAHLRAELEAERGDRDYDGSATSRAMRDQMRRELETAKAVAERQLAETRAALAATTQDRDALAEKLHQESRARAVAQSQVVKLQQEADRLDKQMLAKVSELQLSLADLKSQNEELESSSSEEIKTLKIQLEYAQEEIRQLDRKLSQEVAARAALEASRDWAARAEGQRTPTRAR